jgi:hypothetical protein
MSQKFRPHSRRTFIKNMALMGGAGALLAGPVRTLGVGPREESNRIPDKHRSQGYRLTPHIRKYYKNAAA